MMAINSWIGDANRCCLPSVPCLSATHTHTCRHTDRHAQRYTDTHRDIHIDTHTHTNTDI